MARQSRFHGVRLLAGGLLAVLALLSGCAGLSERMQQVPPVDLVQPSAALPVAEAVAPVPSEPPVLTGAIFQADRYRPLFENHRARIVGDTLMINITEKVSAVQKSTSSVNRKSSMDAGVSALPFLKSSALTRATATGSICSSFITVSMPAWVSRPKASSASTRPNLRTPTECWRRIACCASFW